MSNSSLEQSRANIEMFNSLLKLLEQSRSNSETYNSLFIFLEQ